MPPTGANWYCSIKNGGITKGLNKRHLLSNLSSLSVCKTYRLVSTYYYTNMSDGSHICREQCQFNLPELDPKWCYLLQVNERGERLFAVARILVFLLTTCFTIVSTINWKKKPGRDTSPPKVQCWYRIWNYTSCITAVWVIPVMALLQFMTILKLEMTNECIVDMMHQSIMDVICPCLLVASNLISTLLYATTVFFMAGNLIFYASWDFTAMEEYNEGSEPTYDRTDRTDAYIELVRLTHAAAQKWLWWCPHLSIYCGDLDTDIKTAFYLTGHG